MPTAEKYHGIYFPKIARYVEETIKIWSKFNHSNGHGPGVNTLRWEDDALPGGWVCEALNPEWNGLITSVTIII